MSNVDLATAPDIDFADVQLTYDGFRRLATNPHQSAHGRIGFPDSYRERHEADIFADICAKLPALRASGRSVLDIGPGCANLPRLLIDLCTQQDHRLFLIDSPEMLSQLPNSPGIHKIEGAFPACLAGAERIGAVDVLLCYSVLHYLFVEANPFHVVDTIVALLAPGGAALLGDIPNASKRRRFFASAAGQTYHTQFTGSANLPDLPIHENLTGRIDDSVLHAMIARAQASGCDAYLLPQAANLPMANRRDDLLIRKP